MRVMSRGERPIRARYRCTSLPEPRWPASIKVISSSTMRWAFDPINRSAWTPGSISTHPPFLRPMLRAEGPPEKVRDRKHEQHDDELAESRLIHATAEVDAGHEREERGHESE